MFAPALLRRLGAATATVGLALLLGGAVVAQEPSPSPEASPLMVASPAPSSAPIEARPEGTWDVIAFDPWEAGLVEPSRNTSYTVSFGPDGRLEGLTGCGEYHGGYLVEGQRLDMRVISKGPDPCSVKRTEEAVAFSVAVDSVASWRALATGLELLDEAGSVRLALGRATETDLTGDWLAERLAKANGRLAPPPAEVPITVGFDAAGGVSGSTGCRFFEGLYQRDGDQVVIAPIETAGLPCEGDARRSERLLLRAFDQAVLWSRDADGLTLSDGFGAPLLVLRPAPAEATPEADVVPAEEGT